MKITPLDIRRKEFKRSVRGYLDEEVDIFLDTVADEVERVYKLNAELEKKVQALEEQAAKHAQLTEALEKTLVAAQLQSEEMLANAEQESQSILREAEAKAKGMVDEFYGKTQAVQESLARMKSLEEDFRLKFRGLLEGYLSSLAENPAVVALPDVPEAGLVGSGSPDAVTEAAVEPPSLPQTAAVQAAQVDQATQAGETQKESPVYFGHKDEDLDDPFPEIGGATAKPRDFAW